jgi:hypothetical protein
MTIRLAGSRRRYRRDVTCSLQPSEYLTSMLPPRTFAHTTRPRLRKVSRYCFTCAFDCPAFFSSASSSPSSPRPGPEFPPPPGPELSPPPGPEVPLPGPELSPEPLPDDPELPLVPPPEPPLPELDPPFPDPLAAALTPQPNTAKAARPRPSSKSVRLVHFDCIVPQFDPKTGGVAGSGSRHAVTLARRGSIRERFRTSALHDLTLVGTSDVRMCFDSRHSRWLHAMTSLGQERWLR